MKDLTLYESMFLLAILRLGDNAYGVAIREEVTKVMERTISYGTLYSYLDQIFRKGYVTRTVGDPTPERGGRRKTFYKLSTEGKKALKISYKLQKAIWEGVSEL